MIMHRLLAVAALASLAITGCADLSVQNPNDPDRERTFQTASDIENLIAGGYRTWWSISGSNSRPGPILMTLSYQHSATAANFGMVEFSSWPKSRTHHLAADQFHSQNVGNAWVDAWRAVSVAVEGLKTLDEGTLELPPDRLVRARAYGFFMLGLAHATVASLYDQGYIYDPSVEIEDVTLHPYPEVWNAAEAYFGQAIAEAQAGPMATIPSTWMSRSVEADQLVRLIHSYRARFRAAMARTPEERQAVNWDAVLSDIDNGITDTWFIDQNPGSEFAGGTATSASVNIFRLGPWGQMSYQYLGMADQSGQFQRWFAMDPWDRHPLLGEDDPFLIVTPDERFAQGSTVEEQRENEGSLFHISRGPGGFAAQWVRPDRGSFRWSYYRYHALDDWANNATPENRHDFPEIRIEEMNLLRAEALFRNNNLAGAADIINQTRTAAGLNATDAAGTNTDCVPRLPNAQCGDLWEMLKWEVRLETMYTGLFMAPWYFHHRGWGDLTEGSFLQLPVAARDGEILGIELSPYGGTFPFAAPVGTYGN